MASRLRPPARVQLPPQLKLSCAPASPHSCRQSRGFILSARLRASNTARPPNPAVRLRSHPSRPSGPSSPSRSSSSSKEAQPLDVLFQQYKWPLVGAGFATLGMSLYVSMLVTSLLKDDSDSASSSSSSPCSCPSSLPAPTGRPAILNNNNNNSNPTSSTAAAQAFDKDLDLPELLTGIRSLRKRLAARARGHVLEVAVGTGRNLAYYDWRGVVERAQDEAEAARQRERERLVRLLDRGGGEASRQQGQGQGQGQQEEEVLSWTGVDVSAGMMGSARDRIREEVPGLRRIMRRRRVEPMPVVVEGEGAGVEPTVVVDVLDGRVRLVLEDAVRGLPPPPPPPPVAGTSSSGEDGKAAAREKAPDRYDTIIQTFGLCSVADPAKLLANMAANVQPDTGRILLLEHGRGWFDWLNRKLDQYALRHFNKYGCWWNRDIEQLVRDAARTVPGLEVVSLERPLLSQAGTTLLIELRVKSQQETGK